MAHFLNSKQKGGSMKNTKEYNAGFQACQELYKEKYRKLLEKFYVYDKLYVIDRSSFKELIREKELMSYIDEHIFKYGVKKPRKSVEFLILGNYVKGYQTPIMFDIGELIEQDELDMYNLLNFIIERMRKRLLKSM